jgi:hypothetical protein
MPGLIRQATENASQAIHHKTGRCKICSKSNSYMSNTRKAWLWIAGILAAAGTATTLLLMLVPRTPPISLRGAIIARSADPNKEVPIAGAEITAADGLPASDSKSAASGFFRITLPPRIRPGHRILLRFRHPGYEPLDLNVPAGNQLYVIRMSPIRPESHAQSHRLLGAISKSTIRVRYTVKAPTALDVGSQVKTLQVVNTGNVPCNGRRPCSPDGKWKAAIGSAVLDAGEGNVFRNVRVSCIAGPCPFTRIFPNGFSHGGRRIMVSARDWSDTATFLIEADVFHPMASDDVRVAYPFVVGRTLSFTVPASAEGVCLDADVNGEAIVFPLGPELILPWASCVASTPEGQTRIYRCELKPGYRFQ